MKKAIIYCDGSFDKRTQLGGYGAVVLFKNKTHEFSEAFSAVRSSTRAEMIGMIRVVEVYHAKANHIEVYTDAKTIVDGLNIHMDKWIKTSMIHELVNSDLWFELRRLSKGCSISWNWVKGHHTNIWNNRADQLAREAVMGIS